MLQKQHFHTYICSNVHSINTIIGCDDLDVLKCELQYAQFFTYVATDVFQKYICYNAAALPYMRVDKHNCN